MVLSRCLVLVLVIFILSFSLCFAQEGTENPPAKGAQISLQDEAPKVAGEFFGMPVPINNYYFAKRAVVTFNASWRGTPKDEKALEDMVWQELLFSFETFRRGITVEEDEIDEQVEKFLKADKVKFRWRVDKEKFKKWAKEKLNMPIEYFRRQIEHLVKIEKLRKQVLESIEPEVSEEEAYQKFLDEYNTLLVELKQFDDLEQAKKLYEGAILPLKENAFEKLIWRDLLLLQEAALRKIKAEDKEIERKVVTILREYELRFNWKKEPEKFKGWIQETFGISEDVLRWRVACFIKIDKLIEKIAAGEEPDIDESKTYEKFLEEQGTYSQAYEKFFEELVQSSSSKTLLRFDSLNKAKEFYEKIDRKPGFWEDRKRETPKQFKQPGFVALDFLINMWGFQKEDAYKMLDEKIGSFYPPAPIYKGYGVFKILKIRKADIAKYEERKDYYFDRVKNKKKYEGLKKWVEDLKEQANIKVFIK